MMKEQTACESEKETKNIKDKPYLYTTDGMLAIELLENLDAYKTDNFNINDFLGSNLHTHKLDGLTGFGIIIEILKACQKDKDEELTLEEKLIRDGWKSHTSLPYCGYLKNNIFVYHISYACDIRAWKFIKDRAEVLSIPFTEDYEIIKKVVELVKIM